MRNEFVETIPRFRGHSGGACNVKNAVLNRMYESNIDFDRDGVKLSPRCDLMVFRTSLSLTRAGTHAKSTNVGASACTTRIFVDGK